MPHIGVVDGQKAQLDTNKHGDAGWNDDVSNRVREKCKLWKERKQRNTSKERYLEVKKEAKRAVYQAKCKAERKRFGNVVWRDDQKCDVIKIAKRMVKSHRDINRLEK